jgi:hypothetical protein
MIHDEVINNKLLVLFILEKLEMQISEDSLLQMCAVDNNWIPYFYCKQVISELAGANFILRNPDENKTSSFLVSINEDGKVCLSHFFKDIPCSVREEVTAYIRNTKLEYKRKQEFCSKCNRDKDGSYKVSCQILKAEESIFKLSFNVATHGKALSICNNWTQKAPEVYKTFLDILID